MMKLVNIAIFSLLLPLAISKPAPRYPPLDDDFEPGSNQELNQLQFNDLEDLSEDIEDLEEDMELAQALHVSQVNPMVYRKLKDVQNLMDLLGKEDWIENNPSAFIPDQPQSRFDIANLGQPDGYVGNYLPGGYRGPLGDVPDRHSGKFRRKFMPHM